MELSAFQSLPFQQLIFLSLAIGVIFFLLSIVVMILLFGWSLKDTLDHTRGMAVFLLLSLLTPFGVISFQQNIVSSQAAPSYTLQNLDAVVIDEKNVLISFDTEIEALVYLEVTDTSTAEVIPVLPSNNFEKRTSHSFLIEDHQRKEIVFVVNGTKQYINGKPYRIVETP